MAGPGPVDVWRAEVFVPDAGALCEGPRWDERSERLLWVDILAGRLHEADITGRRLAGHDVGLPLGSFAPRESGGHVLALETGFAVVDADWSAGPRPIGTHRSRPTPIRFNDGVCDPFGRFFAGTMDYDEAPGAGTVFRLDPPGADGEFPEAVPVITGTTVSNGLGWSDDGRTMYFVDSVARTVDAFDYDPGGGTPTNRRTLISIAEGDGFPDGLAVAADGFLWLALWDGGQVRRYTPDGELAGIVEVPVGRVSACTFAGPDLDELIITTARQGLDEATLAAQPASGSLFRCRTGHTGRPVSRYHG
ncbi:SMP-30/gluconolactonase/LRE family protein [Catenulispora subtropica]|uniref:SMP-30/gluconolactonase/LRE family protein n=1 Tax=Catenulispora subtropica TaxID=450798 RepID=A0ABN2T1E4_9ACTN